MKLGYFLILVCLELKTGFEGDAKAELFDLIGRKVGSFSPGVLRTGTSKFFINVAGLPEGVYSVVVSDQKNNIALKLLVN
ncbi:MAG: T9SS type A sorting domain-containing protein [Ferruginibacter sp.]